MSNGQRTDGAERADAGPDWYPLVGAGVLLLVLVGWMLVGSGSGRRSQSVSPAEIGKAADSGGVASGDQSWGRRFGVANSQTAEQVVATRVAEFARKRLEWIRAKSLRAGHDVPQEVEDFFKALERGKWDEIDASFGGLSKRSGQYEHSTHWAELDPFWPAVLEAYGAAEQAHLWPAEKLLAYGNDILGSLKPGMVYIGGTDPGRFIPTLLNETGESEQHRIITQNALADSRYLEYLREQYGADFAVPAQEDSRRFFEDYVTDARKRFEHDQQFPDEPKQIKPGEMVEVRDGKTEVSGQVAVMTINEKLVQWMIERNPEASFALEESLPMRETYKDAVPLGPIMEIHTEAPLEAKDASATVERWREFAADFQAADPSDDDANLRTYAHMAVAQANLLAARNLPEQAQSMYQLASDIFPRSTDAVMNYAQFLSDLGRPEEAQRVLSEFQKRNPDLSEKIKPEIVVKA